MVWKVAVEGGRGGEGGLDGLATRPANRRAKLRTLSISEDVRCDLDDGKTSWTQHLELEALNLEDYRGPQVRGSKVRRHQVPAYPGHADEIGTAVVYFGPPQCMCISPAQVGLCLQQRSIEIQAVLRVHQS